MCGLRLVPAQLHLVLLHTHHMETRGRQQVWEQWQPYMSNPYVNDNSRVVFAVQRLSDRVWEADCSWMQFGAPHTYLSHSLCLCVLFCKHNCSCLSCHSCRRPGFRMVVVHTGSPLEGDKGKQLVQHGTTESKLCELASNINKTGSTKSLTHLALVTKETIFAQAQIIMSVTPTHASI